MHGGLFLSSSIFLSQFILSAILNPKLIHNPRTNFYSPNFPPLINTTSFFYPSVKEIIVLKNRSKRLQKGIPKIIGIRIKIILDPKVL